MEIEEDLAGGGGCVADLVPDTDFLHSGRIGGVTRLAKMSTQPWDLERQKGIAGVSGVRQVEQGGRT